MATFCPLPAVSLVLLMSTTTTVVGFSTNLGDSSFLLPKHLLTLRTDSLLRRPPSSPTTIGRATIGGLGQTWYSQKRSAIISTRARILTMSASARDVWSVTGVGLTSESRPFGGEPGADVCTWRHDEYGTGIELWQVGLHDPFRAASTVCCAPRRP
jgi:hypothetical protein